MNTLKITQEIFKQKNSLITLAITFLLSLNFLLGSIKYLLPSFEEQIMSNTIDSAKRVSNLLINVYEKEKDYSIMADFKDDLGLQKIKFFDKKGTIIYSTDKEDIGTLNKKEYFHNIVAKGKVYYTIVKKGGTTAGGVQIKEVDIAEIYVPIMKNGKFQYAFEVYYDITKEQEQFDNLVFKIRVVSYLVVLLVFIIVISRLYSSVKGSLKEKHFQEQLHRNEKMASMGEMIGNIAHQWRQPLSVISTSSTGVILQESMGTLDKSYLIKEMNNINEKAQYLSKTIDDFRDFIKGDIEKTLFNLTDTIEKCLKIEDGILRQNQIQVIKNLNNDISLTNLPHGLAQSLVNIINNAKDVMVNNQDESERFLFIETKKDEDNAIIILKDSGGGINNDIMSKIFEPYFTTKHQSQGTGLGLHMTYNIITDHMNGTIEVTNETYTHNDKEYIGATFIITLPNIC
jgi:signal transduction histidine kinase